MAPLARHTQKTITGITVVEKSRYLSQSAKQGAGQLCLISRLPNQLGVRVCRAWSQLKGTKTAYIQAPG